MQLLQAQGKNIQGYFEISWGQVLQGTSKYQPEPQPRKLL